MQVLVVGGGGREHALVWKLAQSERVDRVYVAPGNAGTQLEAKTTNLDIPAEDIDQLLDFAVENHIELTIVGPEAPLVAGIVDKFQATGLRCLGPSAAAAQLEGSKSFTKRFLERHQIPTADYRVFEDAREALAYVRAQGAPIVVKADGLAAGKGVVVAQTVEEAEAAIQEIVIDQRFGTAGKRVVVEECLVGEEASFICVVDGRTVLPLASSQDHKARDAGDKGPNTGGMGAYSPAPVVTPDVHERIMSEIIQPTVEAMASENMPYRGFLYAGLMIDQAGHAKVLEYNCRFGDPETQPILMRLKTDLAELCEAAVEQRLDRCALSWDSGTALGVVMAAGGYPGDYRKGYVIHGLDHSADQVKVFHAGTQMGDDGNVLTSGGRVLCVTALGEDFETAQSLAYASVRQIHWQDAFYRPDIGYRAVARDK